MSLHPLVGRLGARLPGIVVADEERVAVHLAAMDLEHLVFQDRRVVVEVALEDGALGNLDQLRGDFDGAVGGEMRVPRAGCLSGLLLPARTEKQGRQRHHQGERGPAKAKPVCRDVTKN